MTTRLPRVSGLVAGSFVLLLTTACAETAGRVHTEPPPPQIERASADDQVGESVSPIEPDRPDVTNGAHIVGEGLLQVELGYQHLRMGRTQRSQGTPITLRLGVTEWLELRAGSDGYVRQSDGVTSASGAGNVQAGAKLRLFAEPGGLPVLSILPNVNLPVASASKGLGSGDADYTLALLTGADVGRTSHVDVNYAIGAIGSGGGQPHFVQHLVSVSASHSLTEQLSPYLEAFWSSSLEPHGGRALSIDGGLIQAVTARFAVDGGLAVGLTQDSPDLSVFVGISAILGDVLGDHGVIARQRRAARLQRAAGH